MKHSAHLILAHPKQDSLNGLLYNVAQETLLEHGFKILTSDLYEMLKQNHPATQYYGLEHDKNSQSKIQAEQEKFKQSTLTIVQFPLYWFQFPAVLKSYLEQIWQPGFAYPGKFKDSPLASEERTVLFSISTQSSEADFSATGPNGEFSKTLFPMTVAFRFVVFNILQPFVLHGVNEATGNEVNEIVERYKAFLEATLANPKIMMTP